MDVLCAVLCAVEHCPLSETVMECYPCVCYLPLQSQGSEEQKKKWLPLALDHRILGGYAQTELGHGTIGTTAGCMLV